MEFWSGFDPLFGTPKAEQEKGIGAFLRQRRSRQPAVRTVYEGFQRSRKWRLLGKVLRRLAS